MKNNRTHQCHCNIFFKRKEGWWYATVGPNLFFMWQIIPQSDGILRKDNYPVYIGHNQRKVEKEFKKKDQSISLLLTLLFCILESGWMCLFPIFLFILVPYESSRLLLAWCSLRLLSFASSVSLLSIFNCISNSWPNFHCKRLKHSSNRYFSF